jgi:glycoprotein 2-beta-D-xylosyltransferase
MGTRKRKWRCTGIKKTCVKRVVVLLVVLNALQLLVYLLHSLGVGGGNNAPPLNFPAIVMRQVSGKPWPHLPSFTPWDLKADLDPASCEAFFGNGFTQPFRLLDPKVAQPRSRLNHTGRHRGLLLDQESFRFKLKGGLGAWTSKQSDGDDGRLTWAELHIHHRRRERTHIQPLKEGLFHCFYSETLRTSICEGTNMVMNPKRIKMAKGGEPLDSVIGRNEEEELPYFTSGAFQIFVPERGGRKPLFNKTLLEYLIPKGTVQEHTLHHLLEQIRTIPLNEVTCAQVPHLSSPAHFSSMFVTFLCHLRWMSSYLVIKVYNVVIGLGGRWHECRE